MCFSCPGHRFMHKIWNKSARMAKKNPLVGVIFTCLLMPDSWDSNLWIFWFEAEDSIGLFAAWWREKCTVDVSSSSCLSSPDILSKKGSTDDSVPACKPSWSFSCLFSAFSASKSSCRRFCALACFRSSSFISSMCSVLSCSMWCSISNRLHYSWK